MPRLSSPQPRVSRRARGFTLLELIVVFVVLGLLLIVAIPTYQRVIDAAALTRDSEQVSAIARAATALAAADNARVPGPEHFAEALADTEYAFAPGSAAAPTLSPNFALYGDVEWAQLTEFPDHGDRKVAVTLTVDTPTTRTAGLAMMASRDDTKCVMATVVGTSLVDGSVASVENPLECNGALAVAAAPGPVDTGGGPGGPGGPGQSLRLFGFNMWTASGAFDDFEVTAAGSPLASDDFSGSDGVLLAVPTAQWFDIGVGLPIVTDGELRGIADDSQLLAAVELPTSPWSARATVSKVPTSGFMQMLVASQVDGMATHMVSVNAGGAVSFGGRIPGCGPNDIILNPSGVTVAAGDIVGIDRSSDDVASLVVNDSVVSTVDRSGLDPGLCI